MLHNLLEKNDSIILEMNTTNKYYWFLRSSLELRGSFMSVREINDWIKEQNKKVSVKVSKTTFSNLKSWNISPDSISHSTGKFFSIDGVHVSTNWEETFCEWEQPIINQPEVGFLGFITKEFDGVLHFLLQAKIEPGNINHVQLSPTLQATRSNYTQTHKGNKPLYLEYFQNATSEQILLDQLQSEQGARFYKKRNRNIIIKLDENDDIPVYDNFVWATLGQIKQLMAEDNVVNMDTRTVIAGISYGDINDRRITELSEAFLPDNNVRSLFLQSALDERASIHSIDDIISYITKLKSIYDLEVSKIPLFQVKDWVFTDDEIAHVDKKYFKVIAVDVEISNREVVSWSQPMIQPVQQGLCAFVCKKINGVLHFAVQAKLECGNFDIIEFAPTVQCLTGNYKETKKNELPFLDYVLNVPTSQVIYDVMQSEEGGRFFKEQNRNMIILAGDELSAELPPKYIWMTLNQLFSFIKYNNYLNIQARGLLAAISFV